MISKLADFINKNEPLICIRFFEFKFDFLKFLSFIFISENFLGC